MDDPRGEAPELMARAALVPSAPVFWIVRAPALTVVAPE